MAENKWVASLKDKLVARDITELHEQIIAFLQGKIPDDQFRGLRTSKGVYSQRQTGVQMVRIKLPMGKVSFNQLLCMAQAAETYATGILHITTRQDIQIYGVHLHKTPELWAQLEQEDITLRGSGGNTVRNITASPTAGIDPKEPFDITPYAQEAFRYFLRNPVSQEMGRKIKIAFSSSTEDTAYTYIHDLGFIPKVKTVIGIKQRGFKVILGGGLGAQPMTGRVVNNFLPEDQLIPFIESVLRVFGRYGERNNRHKARLKFLVQQVGLEKLLQLINEERTANRFKSYPVYHKDDQWPALPSPKNPPTAIAKPQLYEQWLATNVFEQKQPGMYGVFIKVPGGDITAGQAKELVQAVQSFAASEIRLTQNQGIMLKFVRKEFLPAVFAALDALGWAVPGFDSTAHITTCRGTNTCNLAITNSMGLAAELEKLVYHEYANLIYNHDIKIKISGCMNSCGQHGLAQIGFHGSSIKVNDKTVPAVQVLLGGGTVGDGYGRMADKIIKVPAKRTPEVLRTLLNDFTIHAEDEEFFLAYYDRRGTHYFYQLLKPLAETQSLTEADYVDWGNDAPYKTAIGMGECAGVIVDLSEAIWQDVYRKLEKGKVAFEAGVYADAIFYAYSVLLAVAKAVLLKKQVNVGSQYATMQQFDQHFAHATSALGYANFSDLAMEINKQEPSKEFAQAYLQKAARFADLLK